MTDLAINWQGMATLLYAVAGLSAAISVVSFYRAINPQNSDDEARDFARMRGAALWAVLLVAAPTAAPALFRWLVIMP